MATKTDGTAEIQGAAKPAEQKTKRLSKGKRTHARRLKQEARKANLNLTPKA